jgi:hypothetical protein
LDSHLEKSCLGLPLKNEVLATRAIEHCNVPQFHVDNLKGDGKENATGELKLQAVVGVILRKRGKGFDERNQRHLRAFFRVSRFGT